jgi:hypothetical protein
MNPNEPGKAPPAGPDRQPYEPPAIEEIEIAPGEAMLGFCKSLGSMGGFGVCGSCGAVGS